MMSMAVLLNGCFGTTPPSRFYSLTPRESHEIALSNNPELFIMVGPVEIPSYLDRSQIVTRTGRNEMAVAEFDCWSGKLEEEITRLLINTLSEQLTPKGIAVVSWRSNFSTAQRRMFRIPVNIHRFDGTLGETVVLSADWGLLGSKEKGESLILQLTTITEEVKGKGYDELVAAMGRVLVRFGKVMAGRISSVLPANTKD